MTAPGDFLKNKVFTDKYWKRTDNENKGDADGNPIYAAVGYALTNWEMAEEEMARLFLALVEADHSSSSPTRRAYGAIGSNSGRRNAIKAAAEAYFGSHWDNPIVYKAFFAVVNAVQWASNRRDDFAHGVVSRQIVDGTDYGAFLFPPDYNTERTNALLYPEKGDPLYMKAAKYRYTSKQIISFANKFKELREAIEYHTGLIQKTEHGILFVHAAAGKSAFGI